MRDGIFWTGLYTKPAKNAAAVVDVVNLGVTFVAAYALGIGTWIILSLNVNTIRGTSCCAEITRYALLLSALVDVKQMLSAISRLHRYRDVGILNGPFLAGDFGKRALHPFQDGR